MVFKSAVRHVQERINALLESHIDTLPSHAPELKAAMKYALLIGGKRTRPFLLYATGNMLGVKDMDLDNAAMAIEAVHAYSLVHDDLPAMDDDALRRGHPTCHIKFDEATAILAGDALQTLAFELLSTGPLSDNLHSKRIDLVRILSQASGYAGMCGGQAMDIAATNSSIKLSELESLHQKKTGALLSAAVDIAITLAGNVNEKDREKLLNFAQTIGLAFQVRDDILDVISDSTTLGKPQGSDQQKNKSTYPAMLGLEGAHSYLAQLHQQALQALSHLPYNSDLLSSLAHFIVEREH